MMIGTQGFAASMAQCGRAVDDKRVIKLDQSEITAEERRLSYLAPAHPPVRGSRSAPSTAF